MEHQDHPNEASGSGGPLGRPAPTGERRSRSASEAARRRSSDALIHSSPDGMLAFDRDLIVTLWNPAMERISGIGAEEAVGRPIAQVFPFLRETDDVAHLEATLEGRTHGVKDRPFHIPENGRRGFFAAQYAPLYDDEGTIIGGLAVVRDTTEEKRREEEAKTARDALARAERLATLGTLVSGVGHELRTPMSYINNHLYLLKMLAGRMRQEDPDMAPIADEIVQRVDRGMKGIGRMSTLLDDLRSVYRPDDGEVQETDLRDAVDEALRLFTGAYEGPVELVKDLGPTGVMDLERERLQQAILNLLNNAAEASPDGGRILVRVRSRQEGTEIVVEDEGRGIAPDSVGSIFEPFFTTKEHGSGLGLYLVKQVVERHMGTIHCKSEVGKGTTFRIVLPNGGSRATTETPVPKNEGRRTRTAP